MEIVILSDAERKQLNWIIDHARESLQQRAQILILQEQRKTSIEIGQVVGLSAGRVRHWMRAFREKRMAIFPDAVLREADDPGSLEEESQAVLTPVVPIERQPEQADEPPLMTVEEICTQQGVDLKHARHVADTARALFHLTQVDHGLGDRQEEILHIAAMLSDIQRAVLQEVRLEGLSHEDQDFLACVMAFLPGKFKPKRLDTEPTCLALEDPIRREALSLAALVRIAVALDDSESQSSLLHKSRALPDSLEIQITGPDAREDVLQALKRQDLWLALYERTFHFVVETAAGTWAEPVASRGGLSAQKRDKAGILADDMMAEAGRKIIRLHSERMLFFEPGTRSGEDIEDLHKMRVATRRMRSAFQLFGFHFDDETLKPILKGLRRTARTLGRVRDWDVFMEKAGHHIEAQSQGELINLEPLLDVWKERREAARIDLMAYLDGKPYARFVEEIGAFATTSGMGVLPAESEHQLPDRVYQVVPTLVYSRYEAIRRYEPIIPEAPLETLHALRIDFKRFRYALEFFQEVLGRDVDLVIDEVVTMQDHLGDLNDADVACQILIDYLEEWRQQQRREMVDISGVTRYLVAKQAELRQLLGTFPASWQHFTRGEVRRALALAVSEL